MPVLRAVTDIKNIVELSFDDRSKVRIRKSDFKAFPIDEGEYVDLDAYEGKICKRQFSDAYEAALTQLDYAARTESALRQKLKFKGYLDSVCDSVIAKLKSARLIDDSALAARLVENANEGSRGVYAIKRRLRAKGLSEADVENALEGIDDEHQAQAAEKTAKTLLRRYEGLPAREARAKLSQALARRGVRWEEISSALEALLDDDGEY